jgi:hypothetical protein
MLLAGAALLIPGFAWWAWFGRRSRDLALVLSRVVGASLSLVVLLAEAAFLLKIPFSSSLIFSLLAFFLIAGGVGVWRRGLGLKWQDWPIHLLVLLLMAAAVGWRLYQARDLVLPNWVDSQHHYLITGVILENRGLPETLSPYLDVPFYYHYGFHAVTAFLTAISGVTIAQGMLVFGQVLSALISLSVYALARALWDDWRPALFAALLVTFVTQMPAYYLTWGRYTLTMGLVLLPLAMETALRLLQPSFNKRTVLVLSLLTASLCLTHYFAALLLAFFMAVLAVGYLWARQQTIWMALGDLGWVALGGGLGLAAAAPWLFRVMRFSSMSLGVQSHLPQSLSGLLTLPGNSDYLWYLLGPGWNYGLLWIALGGMILAVFLRASRSFLIWSGVIAFFLLPHSLSLPPFRPDHFAITCFLPITIWTGWLFWKVGIWLDELLEREWLSSALLFVLLIVFVAWGLFNTDSVINAVTVLVTEDDRAALDWIRENTPPDARFFINTTYWLEGTYRSVDAGGWILPYTERWAIVPTVFYAYGTHVDSIRQIQNWSERASEISSCDETFWELSEDADLNYVYLHRDVGSLLPQHLEDCEGLTRILQNASVDIYEIHDDSK